MGISNGELANETNFNKSFLDKNTDTETVNKISLRRPTSGADVEDVQQDINTNKSDISTNATNISTNAGNIATNTSDISTNAGNISTNTSNISTNTTNISTNASEIQAIEDDYGVANGLATLDGGGKVPASQLPSTLMDYKGNWDANTNTPTLADGVGDSGDVYKVSVAGTQDLGSGSQTFAVGDWVIYNGTIWEKSDNTDAVTSVFGRVGIVTAQSGDYDADQVTETTTRFFQEKNNLTASAPTVSNDSSQGYSVKSQWFDTSTGTLYVCEDASVGAAVWSGISGVSSTEEFRMFSNEQTSGTNRGAYTSGSWQDCVLNTTSGDSFGSLASNIITLPAGTYVADGEFQATDGAGAVRCRLRNTSDGATVAQGTNSYSSPTATSPDSAISRVYVKFTIATSKNFKLQYYVGSGGQGPLALSSGDVEVYESVNIRKLS